MQKSVPFFFFFFKRDAHVFPSRVNELSDLNRMSPQNISIVFGPTLMRPEKDFANIAINMVYQNQVVEDILSECDTIFGQGRDYL